MKALRILSLLALVAVLFTYSSCKDDPNEPDSVSDVQLAKLTKTWKINTVALDGGDRTAEYAAMQLVLTGTKGTTLFNYSTSGRPSLSPWPSNGKWEFGTNPETQIIRDKGTADELAISYTVTETTLSMTFNFNGAGYPSSRTGVVKGEWVFTFKL